MLIAAVPGTPFIPPLDADIPALTSALCSTDAYVGVITIPTLLLFPTGSTPTKGTLLLGAGCDYPPFSISTPSPKCAPPAEDAYGQDSRVCGARDTSPAWVYPDSSAFYAAVSRASPGPGHVRSAVAGFAGLVGPLPPRLITPTEDPECVAKSPELPCQLRLGPHELPCLPPPPPR